MSAWRHARHARNRFRPAAIKGEAGIRNIETSASNSDPSKAAGTFPACLTGEIAMQKTIVKFVLPLLMLSVAIPESEAKRMGGGRSSGRQVQGVRKAPPPQAVRPAQPQRSQQAQPTQTPPARPATPDGRVVRPQVPPASAPTRTLPREAASPWGGMLGGALLGLGLGSLMSRDGNAASQQNPEAQQNQQTQSSGSSGTSNSNSGMSGSGEAGSGASGNYANAPAGVSAANQQTAGTLRSLLPIGLLVLIVYFAVRRMRRRNG